MLGLAALGLCLVYTISTPIADMPAHSPPRPLTIDHVMDIAISLQDTKMDQPLHSSCLIASAVSAFRCSFRIVPEEYPIWDTYLGYLIIEPSTQ